MAEKTEKAAKPVKKKSNWNKGAKTSNSNKSKSLDLTNKFRNVSSTEKKNKKKRKSRERVAAFLAKKEADF